MARDFEWGFKEAVTEVISGIVLILFLNAFRSSGLATGWLALFILLLPLILDLILVFSMKDWGLVYTIAWLFGIWILLPSSLIDFWGIIIYIVAPISIFIIRVYLSLSNNF